MSGEGSRALAPSTLERAESPRSGDAGGELAGDAREEIARGARGDAGERGDGAGALVAREGAHVVADARVEHGPEQRRARCLVAGAGPIDERRELGARGDRADERQRELPLAEIAEERLARRAGVDELIGAKITNGGQFIFLGSYEGQAIRFAESQVRPMGRTARGVRAMALAEGDYLVGMEAVEEGALILSIADNGFGKRTLLEHYRLTNRGGKGVINMKTTKKTGKVVAVLCVKEDSDLMIVSQNGKMIRIEASNIRQAGRSTQGVKLVSLDEDDKVAAASVIPETENGNGVEQESLPIQ